MEKKTQKRRSVTANKKAVPPVRRKPGANAKSRQPQKAPHAKPRKHAPVVPEPVRITPEVVYLAPKPFSRHRLILRLATVIAVVLALILGLSVFFEVKNIEVSGCEQYTAWQVQQASGISEGDQLLTFSRPRAAGKIVDALPYVKSVRIGISLPDTVKIEITETCVTYAITDTEENWWLMDSAGKVVDSVDEPGSYTQILGFTIRDPEIGKPAVAGENTAPRVDEDGNEIPVTVTAQQQLTTALQMVTLMESYGIIGDAASVNVENILQLEVWFSTKYQMLLGDSQNLETKIRYMKSYIDEYTKNHPYEYGIFDLSDVDWIEFQPFTD